MSPKARYLFAGTVEGLYQQACLAASKYAYISWQTEVFFHPKRRWRFDICSADLKLALEFEGGTFANGRHTRGKGFEGDCQKYNEAALLGWIVLRFTGGMTRSGEALQIIERAIAARLEGKFFGNLSLSELASTQKGAPFNRVSELAGAFPDEEDVDKFLGDIYSNRK